MLHRGLSLPFKPNTGKHLPSPRALHCTRPSACSQGTLGRVDFTFRSMCLCTDVLCLISSPLETLFFGLWKAFCFFWQIKRSTLCLSVCDRLLQPLPSLPAFIFPAEFLECSCIVMLNKDLFIRWGKHTRRVEEYLKHIHIQTLSTAFPLKEHPA